MRTSGSPGGEIIRPQAGKTDLVQAGPLIEGMQTGLNRLIGIEEAFSAIEQKQRYHLSGSVDLDGVMRIIEEVQRASAEGRPPNRVFEFLERHTDSARYGHVDYAKAGYAAFLLGVKDRLVEREQRTWAEEPIVREWIGKAAVLRRPPESVTDGDDNWSSKGGPPYRVLVQGKPDSPYYPGGGGVADFHGKIQDVSLEQNGKLILDRGNQEATEIIEMFEAIKDPETGLVIRYVPRLSVEAVSISGRFRRGLRNTAIRRLGPELPED